MNDDLLVDDDLSMQLDPDQIRRRLEAAGLLQPGSDVWADGSGTWYGSMKATCSPGVPILKAGSAEAKAQGDGISISPVDQIV